MLGDPLVRVPDILTQPQASGGARFLLGVDGGATKTLAAVLDLRSIWVMGARATRTRWGRRRRCRRC
jgi:hypothetical protein